MPLHLITWVRACTEMTTDNYNYTRSISHNWFKTPLFEHFTCVLFQKKNSISARKYINCWGYLVFWFPPISLSSTRVNADARFMIWALFELLNKSANISSIKQIRWKLLLESEHKAGQLANDNQKCWRSTTLKSDFYFYFLLILLHFSGCQESQPAFPAQLFGVCRSSRTIQF